MEDYIDEEGVQNWKEIEKSLQYKNSQDSLSDDELLIFKEFISNGVED